MRSDTSHRPRVVVADDDAVFRYTVRMIIQNECEIVGEADNGAAAVELAADLRPDIVLLDISMPVMSGLEALPLIRERLPDVGLIMVSSHTSSAFVDQAFRMGANAYVGKESAHAALPQAIQNALDGRDFVPGLGGRGEAL
jgi:DNA-binding NarL/FixJ family response regulator